MNETDHVKDQLCQRIEELEKEKLELNEQLDIAQQERNSYQHQFARTTEVLGEIHETLNGSGPAIVGMEAAQVRQLKGERDALAAHVERLTKASLDAIHYLPGGKIKAELRDAYDSAPDISLARLKAQWQAEALRSEAILLYDSLQHTDEQRAISRRIADILRSKADSLERQVGGGEA